MAKFSAACFAVVAALFGAVATVSAEDIAIDWVLPYADVKEATASVGDTITFSWTGIHNVFTHPTMDCNIEGAISVGADPAGTSYTFTEEDAGQTIFFSCDIGAGGHCRAGQFMTVTVAGEAMAMDPEPAPVAEEPVAEEPVADEEPATDEEPAAEDMDDSASSRRSVAVASVAVGLVVAALVV